MAFSLGHRERPGARRPLPFSISPHAHLRMAGGAPRPKSVSIPDVIRSMGSPYVPYVLDQGSVGVCYSTAPKIGIEQTLAAHGTPIGFDVSVLDLAILVHALERAELGKITDPLWDWGGDPRDVNTVVSRYGVRPARYRPGTDEEARRSDASPDNIGPGYEPSPGEARGEELDLLGFEKDSETIISTFHEIGDSNPVEEIADTIADLTCVTIAFRATTADMNAGPTDVLDGRDGPANHDVLLNAYETMPDGSLHFEMQNSWGSWADNGCIWVNESFIRTSTCRYATTAKVLRGPSRSASAT